MNQASPVSRGALLIGFFLTSIFCSMVKAQNEARARGVSQVESSDPLAENTPTRLLQNRWELDPDIGSKWGVGSIKSPLLIDTRALRSSELRTRMSAMQNIVLWKNVGYQNREKAFRAILAQLEQDMDQDPSRKALQTTVSAASVLADSKEQIEAIWGLIQENEVSSALEPKLVIWKSDRALSVWRERLARFDQPDVRTSELVVAIEGLASVGEAADAQALTQLLEVDGVAGPLRLVAAKALGQISKTGLEALATRQRKRHGDPLGSLLAAHLLQLHQSPEALAICTDLLGSGTAAAASVALRTIADSDLDRALEACKVLGASQDSSLRRVVAQTLDRSQSIEHLNQQARYLVDVNPGIRELVRENLLQKAEDSKLQPAINDVISYFLRGEKWEGIEQAIRMSVALNQHQRTPSLIPLMEHPRHEVRLWASWSLQKLKVTEEELAAIHKFCQGMTERINRQEAMEQEVVFSTAFLFEALGVNRYRPADAMLRRYVPKADQKMRTPTRASAIYALGKIWEADKNQQLASALVARLTDDGVNPEEDIVRYVAGISAGRIGDSSLVERFDYLAEENLADPITRAAAWAKRQLESQ